MMICLLQARRCSPECPTRRRCYVETLIRPQTLWKTARGGRWVEEDCWLDVSAADYLTSCLMCHSVCLWSQPAAGEPVTPTSAVIKVEDEDESWSQSEGDSEYSFLHKHSTHSRFKQDWWTTAGLLNSGQSEVCKRPGGQHLDFCMRPLVSLYPRLDPHWSQARSKLEL